MSIRVETSAFSDIRFIILGKRLGTTKWDARGRMEDLWEACTQRETYYLSEETIIAITECDRFPSWVIDPEINLAEKTEHGYYIKGVRGRIEWLTTQRNNGRKGGRPKKNINNRRVISEKTHGLANSKPTENLTSTTTITSTPTVTTKNKYISDFDFEGVYERYPRKEGKSEGLKKCRSQIKTPQDFEDLKKSVFRYAEQCIRERREPKFIKQFSSFMTSWRDWIGEPQRTEQPRNSTGLTPEKSRALLNDLNRPHPPSSPKVLELLAKARMKNIDL